jgi:flagellar export protein FliJ
MKPFRFSLQSLRVLREQKERLAQQRFAEALRVCEEAAFQLHLASEELAAGWTALCEELSTGVAATKLLRSRAWCNVLELRQKERASTLQSARRAMDAAWREMMLATRDREVLETYHDKCRLAYDREVQREEQKRLDEVGVRRGMVPGRFAGLNQNQNGKERSRI